MSYTAAGNRYESMQYRRCGRSGLKLPVVSLGFWHNFGHQDDYDTAIEMARTAFDLGVTYFDLANNYGPPYGSAEENFGKMLASDFGPYRDELIIASKAGYDMWPGPYGEWGSRKYLMASIDQSLKRMGLEYVDIFYHHRFDPETPLFETMAALDAIVRQGKAQYVGISNYSSQQMHDASAILNDLGTPCLIHQPRYSMFDRHIETDHRLDALEHIGSGCAVFSPLEQGLLTNKYLDGIPADSRAALGHFLKPEVITDDLVATIRTLHEIAQNRHQSLAQMAIAWALRDPRMTSIIIGASKKSQVIDCVGAIENLSFSDDELARIEEICPVNSDLIAS
jgi:L-glyceraldehyde 3-phosphate reductase